MADNKSTNAVGYLGPLSYAVTRPPYKIHTCDQVLIVEGETFSNPSDYSKREKAWFTLSVYMLNAFTFDKGGKKDSQNLKNHMLLQQITNLPAEIYGAPGCMEYFDSKNMNRVVMCFSDVGTANQIKEAYNAFMKCRLGDSLKDLSMDKIKEIIKAACMGKDITFSDTNKLMSFITGNKLQGDSKKSAWQLQAESDETKKKFNVNPAYDLRVPGSK